MKNTMSAEQKAEEISKLINEAYELLNKAHELADDDEVVAYVEQQAEESDYADEVSGTILGLSDELSDRSREFGCIVNFRNE